MGKNNNTANQQAQQVGQQAHTAYQSTLKQSDTEKELIPFTQGMMNNYNNAVGQQTADYGNIMKGYQDFSRGIGGPTKFSFERVNATNPAELQEGYGYMREAAPGYRDFAKTGGYSGQDIQELRARGIAPIRSAYGNTMMELDRARSLGGNAGAPNYIAAASRAQRDLPGQMADAMTGVNAELANSIRQGKLAGLAGLTGIGGTMGGLASADAGRQLQAALANQGADIQTQGMGEQSRQANLGFQLSSLGGQGNLYGTTPGMASMFGNQALNAYGQRLGSEDARNRLGLGYMGQQLNAAGLNAQTQSRPWWQTALDVAGTAAPYAAMIPWSSRTLKKDIKQVKDVSKFGKYLKELPLYTWKYKGDDITHFGPIAEEFQEKFGIGDGKHLHPVDVLGVMLASQKAALDAK